MVTPAERAGTRSERAVLWMLCRLLPKGFRARQRAEWTGDLIDIGPSGAAARWRYLFAAAWTLPALRAQVRRAAFDAAPSEPRPAIAVTILVRVMTVGLGPAVISWLIAIPFRYFLLDIPGRFERMGAGQPVAYDPGEMWPQGGALDAMVPLWIALTIGAYAALAGPLLLLWVGLVTCGLGAFQRGAGGPHRLASVLLGLGLVALVLVTDVYRLGIGAFLDMDKGLTTASVGGVAALAGVWARRLTRRSRIQLVVLGFTAMAIFVVHRTPLGEAMLSWFLD